MVEKLLIAWHEYFSKSSQNARIVAFPCQINRSQFGFSVTVKIVFGKLFQEYHSNYMAIYPTSYLFK